MVDRRGSSQCLQAWRRGRWGGSGQLSLNKGGYDSAGSEKSDLVTQRPTRDGSGQEKEGSAIRAPQPRNHPERKNSREGYHGFAPPPSPS